MKTTRISWTRFIASGIQGKLYDGENSALGKKEYGTGKDHGDKKRMLGRN